ncbi:MAG: hypothetical protein GOU99_00885 [Candidatus Altiarchaeota archaeon]|nr:hypothetical protein [Candidatus Altiarchaeota archaeon]
MEQPTNWMIQAIPALILLSIVIFVLLGVPPGVVKGVMQIAWVATTPIVALLNTIGKTPIRYFLGG